MDIQQARAILNDYTNCQDIAYNGESEIEAAVRTIIRDELAKRPAQAATGCNHRYTAMWENATRCVQCGAPRDEPSNVPAEPVRDGQPGEGAGTQDADTRRAFHALYEDWDQHDYDKDWLYDDARRLLAPRLTEEVVERAARAFRVSAETTTLWTFEDGARAALLAVGFVEE